MNLFLYIALLIIEILFLVGLSIYTIGLLYSSIMGAPYVPTSQKRIDEILSTAKLVRGQVFLELGSGDGRIVRQAVAKYKVVGIGVDINLLLVKLSRFLAKRQGLHDITFKRENIFITDFSKCDVLYMFLMPEMLRKINHKLKTEMKKGALIISHGFRLEGWDKKIVKHIKSEPFPTFFYRI